MYEGVIAKQELLVIMYQHFGKITKAVMYGKWQLYLTWIKEHANYALRRTHFIGLAMNYNAAYWWQHCTTFIFLLQASALWGLAMWLIMLC